MDDDDNLRRWQAEQEQLRKAVIAQDDALDWNTITLIGGVDISTQRCDTHS